MKTETQYEFSNQNWRKVLRKIVDYAPNKYGRGKGGWGDDHPVAKALRISGHELMLIMSFLEEQGLIEYDKSECNWVNVTAKGFDVALENQSAERATKVNRATVFLGLVVAFASIVQVLVAVPDICVKWGVAIIFAAVISVGLWIINKKF